MSDAERIFIGNQPRRDEASGVTHFDQGTAYVRADLFDALKAENERLRDVLEYVMDGYGLDAPDFRQTETDEDGNPVPDDWIVTAIRAALTATDATTTTADNDAPP